MTCCERQIIIDLVAEDTAPPLALRFPGLVLGDYSSIKLRIRYADGNRLEKTVTPDVGDDELGTVDWDPGDLIFGRHEADVEFTDATGSFAVPRRFPMILQVRGAI